MYINSSKHLFWILYIHKLEYQTGRIHNLDPAPSSNGHWLYTQDYVDLMRVQHIDEAQQVEFSAEDGHVLPWHQDPVGACVIVQYLHATVRAVCLSFVLFCSPRPVTEVPGSVMAHRRLHHSWVHWFSVACWGILGTCELKCQQTLKIARQVLFEISLQYVV